MTTHSQLTSSADTGVSHLGHLRHPASEVFPKVLAGTDKSLGLDLTTLPTLWGYNIHICDTFWKLPSWLSFWLPGLGYLPCLPESTISSHRCHALKEISALGLFLHPCRGAVEVAFSHSAKTLHRVPVGKDPQLGFTQHECSV